MSCVGFTTKQNRTNFNLFGLWFDVIKSVLSLFGGEETLLGGEFVCGEAAFWWQV